MKNFTIGQQVQVTISRIGRDDLVFTSEIVDIVDNHREQGVWVDHPELRGEDMLYVNLSNPNINKVEPIVVKTVEPISQTNQELKSIKKDLAKALKWVEGDVTIRVAVYDCDESGEQTYDVEINYYIDGSYEGGFYTDTFFGDTEKQAVTRAKSVLRTVKGWFDNSDVTVEDGVEVYHA